MRAVVQRVSRASVTVDGEIVGEIGNGLVVLLGIARDDTEEDATYLVEKIAALRIFDDEAGRMNSSVRNVQGALLIVSQFTLYGDVRRGLAFAFKPDFSAVNAQVVLSAIGASLQECETHVVEFFAAGGDGDLVVEHVLLFRPVDEHAVHGLVERGDGVAPGPGGAAPLFAQHCVGRGLRRRHALPARLRRISPRQAGR